MFFDNIDENLDDIIFGLSEAGKPAGRGGITRGYITMLARGDYETKLDEIEQEAKEISTPEQKIAVAKKIDGMLQKFVALRHNKGAFRRAVEDMSDAIAKVIGKKNPQTEINLRLRDAINRLSKAREKVLKKKMVDTKKEEDKEE